MKKMQDQLSDVSKSLSGLLKKVNRLTRQARKLSSSARAKSKPGRKPGKRAAVGGARVRQDTVLDSVYGAIKRSRTGISISQLKSKTALGDRQLSNALYKLTKKGMVYAKSRGIYAKC